MASNNNSNNNNNNNNNIDIKDKEVKLKEWFNKFDEDKDGSLNKSELKKGFKVHANIDIKDDQIIKMMELADSNRNHKIEWDEFYKVVGDSSSHEIKDIAEFWLQYSSKPIIHAPLDVPSWKLLLSGGVAGAVSRTCTSPLERLKILNQVGYMNLEREAPKYKTGVISSLHNMYKTEGFAGLFKGNGTNVVRIAPYSAIQFLSYEKYKKFLLKEGEAHLSAYQNLFVGGAAGVTSLLCTYPLDLIRSRLTVQVFASKYSGISDTCKVIIKEEGVAGLYKGLFASALGVAPYVAINFTTYENLKKYFIPRDSTPTVLQSLSFGAVSGATAQTLTYPIDLIRRRLQVQGIGGKEAYYKGTLDAFRKIIKDEGVLGLYNGMIPCYLKVIPAISISFCVYEVMKKILNIESKKISYSS
ncbi:hypothetical protein DICPUDRAFT_152069 [Dictyostelium purpureum]|uniref:EF-hand domain-containing protein n=1 Tax=Dictyostelium purpureum TaxID=5786 RepID=F0ZKE3_DICPU|nr:uncharacterized protein DICPUDRAFT_152069 [Dictyostelium purpureum]EGC35593.1 hypothetical protein DICPUDRAFT_152069 [Dictyostelium purpureum]|eukprot:XP_003287896.1 hypothetical protein DICPUDRAFT_152069 [Dictyostelium purpureum]